MRAGASVSRFPFVAQSLVGYGKATGDDNQARKMLPDVFSTVFI